MSKKLFFAYFCFVVFAFFVVKYTQETMFQTLSVVPLSFWVVLLLLLGGGAWSLTLLRQGLGLPMLAVLGTAAAWYVGDAFYNDYANNHAEKFARAVLEKAWWQVAWFILSFLILAPVMHGRMNAQERGRSSEIYRLVQNGATEPQFQFRLNQFFWGMAVAWMVLALIACVRLGSEIPYYFFPFLGYRADPWGRDRIGSGFSSLLSLASYFQLYLAAMFGVVAALARNPRVRSLALLGCCLAWPSYIFDRTRNTLLAVVVPGILIWVCVRVRMGWLQKLALLAGCFMLVNAWLAFIIANRSNTSIAAATQGEGVSLQEAAKETHHEGLNMFEELCWINQFITTGEYKVNHGQRYFAELVNPIPRVLWSGKPMIGLDYAAARGQAYTDGGDITATISTGMIGQGVVNFGGILGPAFAAWLMALWAALLARLDLRGTELGNIPLLAVGMILTFNLGRDITLITLYTFFFGMALVWWVKRKSSQSAAGRRPNRNQEPVKTPPDNSVVEPAPVLRSPVSGPVMSAQTPPPEFPDALGRFPRNPK